MTKTAKKPLDPVSQAAVDVVEIDRSREKAATQEQFEREQRIAQCSEVIGQIKGVQLLVKFGDVASLVWLKEVKEQKIYRDLPGIGTWDKFCEKVGKSRRQIDEDLLNLQTFGDEFLGYVASLRVGYRELRKLRQLSHDGTIDVTSENITIGGDTIPLSPDHREDLQAAIEKIIEDKDADLSTKKRQLKTANELIEKQSRELSKFEEEAERRGMTLDEHAYLKKLETSRKSFDGFLSQFDPDKVPENATPRMKAAYLEVVGYFNRSFKGTYDDAVDLYGDSGDTGWVAPNLRAAE